MKRYRFALEAVLRVRRAQEEAAVFALAAAHATRRRAEEAEAEAVARCDGNVPTAGVHDSEQFRSERDEAERLAATAMARADAVARAVAEARQRQADWTQAARAVAALERLDERRRQEWAVAEQRAEAAVVDESALAGWRPESGDAPVPPPPTPVPA